jgi:hypothetical protein
MNVLQPLQPEEDVGDVMDFLQVRAGLTDLTISSLFKLQL